MFGTPRLRRVLRCCNTHAGPRQTMIPVETDATQRSLDAICRERQVWFRGIGNAAAVALPISPVRSIDLITLPPHTAAGRLAQWISTRQPRSPPVTVAFMNMRNYVAAMDAPEAIAAFGSTDQIYPDGVGLQIAQRLMGLPSFPGVSGTEMVPMLLERIPPDSRIFLLGGSPLLATRCNRAFPERFPGLRLVGTQHGYLTSSEQTRAVARIASARPDVLLIGMGSPLQEQWLARYRSRLDVGLALCVGGLFHYWANDLRRAPAALRDVGLEWAWILAQQPHKWRVYSLDAAIFAATLLRLKRVTAG